MSTGAKSGGQISCVCMKLNMILILNGFGCGGMSTLNDKISRAKQFNRIMTQNDELVSKRVTLTQ